MDIFFKKRFTFWTIILLVILNIATISMLWLNQNRRPGAPPPMRAPKQDQQTLEFLQRELDLTDTQIRQYNQLRQAHEQQTRGLINETRRLKKEMMDEIFNDVPDTTKAMEIAELIGKKQTAIEQITFKHFLDLKELCGKEQVGKLQGLVDEFFRIHPPPGQEKPPSPPRGNRNRN
jgi:protein CpxP